LDAAEAPDPPEKFVEAYRVAKAAGLRLTSHRAEDGPAANVTTCLGLLGCERLDHGYHILEDPAVVARCGDEGVTFTCVLPRPPLCTAGGSHHSPDYEDDRCRVAGDAQLG
jgi:adenosine deaminase